MLLKELPSSFNLCRSSYTTSGTTCAELRDSIMHSGLQGGPGRSFINPATYACAPTPTPTSEGLHPALCFGRLPCWGRVAGGEEIEAEARRPWIQSLSNAPAGVQPVNWSPWWLLLKSISSLVYGSFCTRHGQCLQRPGEGIRSPGAELTDHCKLPCRCWYPSLSVL